MIQAVIFDLDGVIIDSEPIHFKLEKQMFEELEIEVAFQEHCSFVGMSSQNMWEAIVSKNKLSYSVEDLVLKKLVLYIEHLLQEKDLHPIPGVTGLIEELYKNNFKLIIASSSHAEVIDAVLKKFQLSNYFTAKVSGTELTHSKPDPEIFLRAAQLADCAPQRCLVIEDSENGVTASKAAGMKCIGFLNPNSGAQNLKKADVVIKSFAELNIRFIKNIK
jgi:beta-phosphoglucomutase family hydrolase